MNEKARETGPFSFGRCPASRLRQVSIAPSMLCRRVTKRLPTESASVYDDDLYDLQLRMKRFETGLVWSEDPAPRINRLLTNVEVTRFCVPRPAP